MRRTVFCILFLGMILESSGQLVRRKDFDAAFALQVGGETSALTAFRQSALSLRPLAGLKMTFPFTRKWFLGSEVNYSELKYGFADPEKVKLEVRQIQVPLYVKYMLPCNKASVLFGGYGSFVTGGKLVAASPESGETGKVGNWHVGLTVGYEHRIVKHLEIMCRISGGMKAIVEKQPLVSAKRYPLQACITLSYDIFRIGDCGCD